MTQKITTHELKATFDYEAIQENYRLKVSMIINPIVVIC